MTKKLTTTIEIETREMVIIRRAGRAAPSACPTCGEKIMLTPEQTTEVTGVSQRDIFRSIESGTVHFQDSSDGKFYVCLNSLS